MSDFKLTPVRLMPRGEMPLGAPAISPNLSGALAPGSASTQEGNFGDLLSGMLQGVNALSHESGVAQNALMNGEATDLHQVMIAAEEAGVSFDLLLEVRNKLVEGYQELMRMPI